jgi:hypothetical protein
VAELADAADSKSAGALLCVGSTPSSGTNSSFSLEMLPFIGLFADAVLQICNEMEQKAQT